MALTKLNWYLSTILIVAIVFSSLLLVGRDLQNKSGITLDNDSATYIDDYAGYMDQSGFDEITDTSRGDIVNGSILGEDEGAQSITDILANLNFYKSKIQPLVNKLLLVYNMPTLIVKTTSLPIGEFNHVLNSLAWILFIAFVVFIIKLVRGS